MQKITIDIALGIMDVWVVKRIQSGYLVSTHEVIEGVEPTHVFHVKDENVIPRPAKRPAPLGQLYPRW